MKRTKIFLHPTDITAFELTKHYMRQVNLPVQINGCQTWSVTLTGEQGAWVEGV